MSDTGGHQKKPERVRKQSAIQKIRRRVAGRDPAEVLAFERRCLVVASVGLLLAFLLWCIAVSTDFLVPRSAGEWRPHLCESQQQLLRPQPLWPVDHLQIWYLNGTQEGAANYTRTETAFAIITFLLIVMGFGFALYTFKEPRYMFKRLAAGVHFIAAGCSPVVVIEVVINSVEYEEQYLTARHPKGAIWTYGYSFVFACLTFVALPSSVGSPFCICSRKKKGDRSGQGTISISFAPGELKIVCRSQYHLNLRTENRLQILISFAPGELKIVWVRSQYRLHLEN
ncbi:uncharacterized protein CEXT_299411 [Caerostris extrusa]|uniref:Uncharacterized protein n=1 Tax=Caerostris extrusa TaxID=172846 RepID=A0AAV4NCU8_CAEEX|nr:uncharacterized protein CEXT_299411 [Caerostris extrusa]